MVENYTDLVNRLHEGAEFWELSTPDIPHDSFARMLHNSANAIQKLYAELKLCNNELCYRCGSYKTRHQGSCDGCRWNLWEY